jgi:hypothetical protein
MIKNKFLVLIGSLLLGIAAAFGQTTVTFPPGRLASEAFVKAYVDSVLKAQQAVKLPPIIPVEVPPVVIDNPPVVALKPCDAGPEIRNISAITEQSLTVLFHGQNVLGLDYQILKEGATKRSGKIRPESNTLTIGYESLPAGTYTLRLSGNTCLGASTREFTIEKWSGQANPPKVPDSDRGRVDASDLVGKFHIGISVPNGNTANHLAALAYGTAHGYNTTGIVFAGDDIASDTDWNLANWQPYDHTQAAPGEASPGSHAFDAVVRAHYLAGKQMRVMLPLGRSWRELAGQRPNQVAFWSGADSHMRVDGTTPTYQKNDGPVPNEACPSLASAAVRKYAVELVDRFFRRYLAAIQDGTILAIGLGTEANAEAQFPYQFKEADGRTITDPFPQGDFNPAAVARFKRLFTQYADKSNGEIANASLSSPLGQAFWWHEADMLREIEWLVIDHVNATFPALTRPWYMVDVGSFADGLSLYRRTFNIQARSARREYLLIKSNDDPSANYAVDYTISAAQRIGGIAYLEPSPQGDFTNNPGQTIATTARAVRAGMGISLLASANDDITYNLVKAAGVLGTTTVSVPISVADLTLNLTDILIGGNGYVSSQWQKRRAETGKEYVRYTIVDNVKPAHLIRAPR